MNGYIKPKANAARVGSKNKAIHLLYVFESIVSSDSARRPRLNISIKLPSKKCKGERDDARPNS